MEFRLLDLNTRDLSKKEWESIISGVSSAEVLIDTTSKYYKSQGYAFKEYDPLEELILHPELLKTPILRFKNKISIGIDSSLIKEWLKCNM